MPLDMRGIGGHQSPVSKTTTWLTPPEILGELGNFDLDPCAAPEPRPWRTADRHYTKATEDGLLLPWFGRVWLSPPYGAPMVVAPWMRRMAAHDKGMALLFARTETSWFHETVWGRAKALLFFKGRQTFCFPDGTRPKSNSGAPCVLIAYGQDDAEILAACGLEGKFVRINP